MYHECKRYINLYNKVHRVNGFFDGKNTSINNVRSQTTLSITKLKLSPQEGFHRLEREKWFEDLRQVKNLKIKVFYRRFLFLKRGFHTIMDQGMYTLIL